MPTPISARARPETSWLVGGSPRLLSTHPGPQGQGPWSDYARTLASEVGVQPSAPAQGLDNKQVP